EGGSRQHNNRTIRGPGNVARSVKTQGENVAKKTASGKVKTRKEPRAAKNARENRHKYFMGIAMAVRLRANCTGNRVGAVIALDNRIVSTGYNGTPENMPNCLEGGCYRCANRNST